MSAYSGAFRTALRATFWRGIDHPIRPPTALHIAILVLATVAVALARDWVASGADGRFQLYGVNALIASEAAAFAVVALFASRRSIANDLFVLGWVYVIISAVIVAGEASTLWLPKSGFDVARLTATVPEWAGLVALAAYLVWLVGSTRRVFLSVEGAAARRPTLRALGLVAALHAAFYAVPQWPVFAGDDFRRKTANLYELVSALRASERDPIAEAARAKVEQAWAAIELEQPKLLDGELSRLTPRRTDEPNLFVVGIAGWSDQDVFLREIRGSLDVLDARFGTAGRTLRLINHEDTAYDTPIANLPNLAASLRGLAERMDRERDVLMLVLTSHGSRSGFALDFGPIVSRTLDPESLKSALDAAGIRNRIIIVSACHSGVFVPVLADEHTVVMSASSAERNSFGCSNEREWTYFGDAFFNQALREGGSIPQAFASARQLVSAWEARDGHTPSDPQIHVGPAIQALLPTLLGRPDRAEAVTGGETRERESAVH